MGDSDCVPSYLKSLEAILSKIDTTEPDTSTAVVQEASPQATTSAVPSLSLSSIGFGTMFTSPSEPATQSKLKCMLVSTHCHQFTGYSKVSHGILSELATKPWLQLTHYAFQKIGEVPQGFRPYSSSIDVIDAAALEKPIQQGFGYQALPDTTERAILEWHS